MKNNKNNKKKLNKGGKGNQSQSRITTLKVSEAAELMTFLMENLSGKSRNNIKSLLVHRQVRVGNKTISQYNHPLKAGDTVEVQWAKVRTSTSNTKGVEILFEDDHLIVISKDTGLLSMGTDKQQERTAYNILKEHVKVSGPENKVFIVHRLDRDTSGVMMFAKTPEAQQIMQSNWKKQVQERTYVALVEGRIKKDSDTMISWLKENSAFVTYSSKTDNGGKKAVTHYNVLKRSKGYSLAEVKIATGRKNQIRIHMKELGHPIVGDKKYGASTNPLRRLGLHAQVLAFKHPITNEILRFETRIPKKFTDLFKYGR